MRLTLHDVCKSKYTNISYKTHIDTQKYADTLLHIQEYTHWVCAYSGVYTQDLFSCWWMGTHASARRSAHSTPLSWSSHSAARLHYYGTGFEEWRPPNERTHLHVWVPGCVANWFLGFLESREMSAQITHSYLGRRIEGGRTCWTKLVLTMGPAEKCVHPLWAETLSVTGHPASCSLN